MPTFITELSDLAIMLALICAPLATGAILIPIGRALAERVRRGSSGRLALDAAAEARLMTRLDRLETTMTDVAIATEQISANQRSLTRVLRDQKLIGETPDISQDKSRVITPH